MHQATPSEAGRGTPTALLGDPRETGIHTLHRAAVKRGAESSRFLPRFQGDDSLHFTHNGAEDRLTGTGSVDEVQTIHWV